MFTRFAPSPTGRMHLGHVAAMIHVWGLAARVGAAVHVRIEDHDRQRCRPEFTAQWQDDLEWLGFAPVAKGRWSLQSEQEARYQSALSHLRERGLLYACRCSRRTLGAGEGAAETPYPGVCRELGLPDGPGTCLRVRLPDDVTRFHDARHGWQEQRPSTQCGDLVVRDRHGHWTYQFAVVVDDMVDCIDWIIRGDDLLESTGRQILLARLLGRAQPLFFFHHPLIVSSDGRKLSKRDAAAPVRVLRERGAPPESVLGQAANRCGLTATFRGINVSELADLFSDCAADQLFGHPIHFPNAVSL